VGTEWALPRAARLLVLPGLDGVDRSSHPPPLSLASARAFAKNRANGNAHLSPRAIRFRRCSLLGRYMLAAAFFFAPQMLWAQSGGQFEQPPIINATELLPASSLSGPGFHVAR
jgi:hypothetical protein